MTATSKGVIKASRIGVAAIPDDLAQGEVDSAKDLLGYQEVGASGGDK